MNRSPDWLKQAERDLGAAENAARAGYHEWAAFGAQQSAEKAAQALAQALHGDVRRHAVAGILSFLPARVSVPETIRDAAKELDQVYVTSRYPNGFASGTPGDYFTEKTSRRLLDHARQILESCRSQISGLPAGSE